ncbi:MAG: hypothetical protein QOG42_526, partial [Solirubrobacteraceae bacterium]|nr:hypothetical protein [Solirubrobacteraceae bacterium]
MIAPAVVRSTPAGEQPACLPPSPAAGTDPLLGVGRWPSVSAGYHIAPGSPPAVAIELRFDAAHYAAAGSAGPANEAVLADRQTLAQAYHQLNEVDADGRARVTITVASSLDGGTPHELAAEDGAKLRELVLESWQYLDGLLAGTVPARIAPISATVSVPVAAGNAAHIYALTVSLTLSRAASLAAAAASHDEPAADATLAVAPLLGDPAAGAASLADFATTFEQAYRAGDIVRKLGVGSPRAGGHGTAPPGRLWVVHTSAAPWTGLLGCEVSGAPVFWAPAPLSRELVSHADVELWPIDPERGLDPGAAEQRSYAAVDLDVWARQALEAIDALLSPRYELPTCVLDARGSTTYLYRLRAAKAAIAASIAGTVQGVLTTPPAPTDRAAIDDAQDRWKQQLLLSLSSAYDVAVAVQLPVTVSCTTEVADGAPALCGHPVVAPAETWPAPPCSLSTFEVAVVNGPSHLTFLLTANDPREHAYAALDLGFRIDAIEHRSASADGGTASTWLTFPNALPELPLSDPQL